MASTTLETVGGHTAVLAGAIKPIDTGAVHKICSGQVVLSLATAVKELVENSLDAGSTSVEIRLKEYGLESIEVVDNGCGVEEHNFQALTLKHHTSKLNDFEDLINVNTFGFRGEALSSLCCLGNLVVVTCHRDSSVGMKLEFNHSGKLVKQTSCSRQTGTTVTVQNLFSTLPVRHKEFTKNVKREFAKMLQVLYAYCLVSTDARISCTNQVGKSKNVVVSTQVNSSLKDNICSVFGCKQIASLLEFRQHSISQAVLDENSLKECASKSDIFSIRGFVSSCQHGLGRSSSDRQFYYINGRPCDLNKLSKLVNDVYHAYNRHQYPFIMLNIALSRDSVDINVTPDKRLLFFDNEKILLAIVKSSLVAMFEPLGSIVQSVHAAPIGAVKFSSDGCRDPQTLGKLSPVVGLSPILSLKRSFSFARNSETGTVPHETSPVNNKQPRVDSYFVKTSPRPTASPAQSLFSRNSSPEEKISTNPNLTLTCTRSTLVAAVRTDHHGELISSSEALEIMDSPVKSERSSPSTVSDFTENASVSMPRESCDSPDEDCESRDQGDIECVVHRTDDINPGEEVQYELDETCGSPRKSVMLTFSVDRLKARLKKANEFLAKPIVRKFRAKIDPGQNSAAEEELTKEISKNSFAKMDIIGQFNLGFIIAKLESDLFIVDQHATDEKYNFEMLRKNTVLDTQPLIRPMHLELTAMNETILMANHETFCKNGFIFKIDEEAKPCNRIKLVAVPVSKNWAFGKEDIEEMLFMLNDAAPGVMCRPSRIQEMFASRACRKSVKIGTALSLADMRKLITHMGEMDQPWNCPHQRPTIRHLVNLDMIEV